MILRNPTPSIQTPVSVANGGTGSSTAGTALTALGAAASGVNADITQLTAIGAEDGLTAHAGGGQASALVLSPTKTTHRITTCATAADSVVLPTATVGAMHFIQNNGAAAAQVFGTSPDTINGVATATGIVLPVGAGVWFYCLTAGVWRANVNIRNTGTVNVVAIGSSDTNGIYFDASHIAVRDLSGGEWQFGNGVFFFNGGGVGWIQSGFGASGTPAHSFLNDTDTGHYRANANDLRAQAGGADIQGWTSSLSTMYFPLVLKNYTVATLPSASTTGAGGTAFVTDASTTLILGLGLAVVGGGANKVPVYSDGTSWLYG